MSSTYAVTRRCFIQTASSIVSKEIAAELFGLFNQIALLRYEEAESSGFLVLCRPDEQSTIPLVRVEAPFDVRDIRGVRKMLHISEQPLCVLCDGRAVYGFATVVADYPDTLMIQFQHHGVWELRQAGHVIVRINALDDELTSNGLSEDHFIAGVQKVFGALPPAELQHLWSLIAAANRQSRGTNVLISAHAAVEAERLNSQCTRVRPVELTPSLMERLTAIDGTVIIDTHGVCYAIGAILDGAVTVRGDRTRGGRYNSALMYVDSSPFPSLIVVISQDGMVDLVSKPQEITGA
jgi:DisA bacterial checkpoint controller nucleotide-binding